MLTKSFRLGLALAVALGTVGTALADSSWEQSHQRRDEVNDRLAHQNARINQERHEHEITGRQGQTLHRDDARTRDEERVAASRNHGHLTPQEQDRLNHRENAESREIGR